VPQPFNESAANAVRPDGLLLLELGGEEPGGASIAWVGPSLLQALATTASTLVGSGFDALEERLLPRGEIRALARAASARDPFETVVWSDVAEPTVFAVSASAPAGDADSYAVWFRPLSGLRPEGAALARARSALPPRMEHDYLAGIGEHGGLVPIWLMPDLAGGPRAFELRPTAAGRDALRRKNLTLLGGRPATGRYELELGDGTAIPVEDRAAPIVDPETGEVVGAAGVLRRLDQARPALIEAAGRALDLAGGGDTAGPVEAWLIAESDGRILAASAGAEAVLGGPAGATAQLDRWLPGWRGAADRLLRDTAGRRLHVARREIAHGLLAFVLRRPEAEAPTDSRLDAVMTRLIGRARRPVAVLDQDLSLAAANRALEDLLDHLAATARADDIVEILAEAGRSAELKDYLAAIPASSRLTLLPEILHPRLAECRVEVERLPEPHGGLLLSFDARAAVPAEAPDTRWFAMLMDGVADGIVSVSADGVIESFSAAAERIFGLEAELAVGRRIENLVTPGPDSDLDVLELITEISDDVVNQHEMFARRPDGELVAIEVTARPLQYEGRRVIILTIRDITIRRQTEETIRNLAYHDLLTALPNRLLFYDRLRNAIERARYNRSMVTVMLVDLDRFKLINDSLGLQKGDEVLKAVAERFASVLCRSDTVARLGGDEFMMLMSGLESTEAAAKTAQKLLDSLRPGLTVNSHELSLTASIGIALFPHDGDDPETLIKNADTALSRAKEQGRGHYQFYTGDMNAHAFERLMLESRLRRALSHEELIVHYQPQLSVATGRIEGVEALLRWYHPDLGVVPPSEFIPLAEDTGLIVPIGLWALKTACATVRAWHDEGLGDIRLAVNLSGRQFQQEELEADIKAVLDETGFPPHRLELELTESVIMRAGGDTIGRLGELAALGISLAVDDFGTGYSSLAYLKRFPIRSLKIDRSFIRDIDRDANSAAIAQAIIALASTLDLKVIAEGVETEQQLSILESHGCDSMQGFLFSRPLPAEDAKTLIRQHRALPLSSD